jgi:hypothetical protein
MAHFDGQYSISVLKDACLQVLQTEDRPMKAKEVGVLAWPLTGVDPVSLGVNNSGKSRSLNNLNNALYQLKVAGKVHSPGRGLYAYGAGENQVKSAAKTPDAVAQVFKPKAKATKEVVVDTSALARAIKIPTVKDSPTWFADEYLLTTAIASMRCFTGWDPKNDLCKGCPLRGACAKAQVVKVTALMKAPITEGFTPAPKAKKAEIEFDVGGSVPENMVSITAHSDAKCPATSKSINSGDAALYDPISGDIYHPSAVSAS